MRPEAQIAYNDYVRNNLPARHRTGTIMRKELYDFFPEEWIGFFVDLCEDDRQAFIMFATSETQEEVAKHCVWQKIKDVTLLRSNPFELYRSHLWWRVY